ncbi:hypothetical protein RintRC_6238 [Richelia intracellularis]|nr:hypothetical protein RintRC_6238 [Richelia intracellularis]
MSQLTQLPISTAQYTLSLLTDRENTDFCIGTIFVKSFRIQLLPWNLVEAKLEYAAFGMTRS